MKTRQGKCINSEKCPLSREEEIFTIEGDSPFECPLCGTGLTEFVAEDPAPVVPEGTAEREVAAEAEIDTAEGEASPPEPHTTEEWHQAQESVELPLRVEAYPETPEVLPTATEWVEHAEVNTPWVAESVPEADTQPEQRPEAEAKAAEVWWEKTEAATNRGDKSREKPLQIIAPIDRGLWGEDTSEVEDAPEVVAPAAPRMTEKAPPIILVVAVLVVLLVGAGFYAVTH